MVFELGATPEQPVERHLDRHPEVERQVGARGEGVEAADPFRMDPAGDVAAKGGEHVPVGEHDHPRLQRRHDLVCEPIREIDGVKEAEGGRREQVLLLAASHRTANERRGVPFREMHAVTARFEPALEQYELGRLARAVDAFDGDQPARIRVRIDENTLPAASHRGIRPAPPGASHAPSRPGIRPGGRAGAPAGRCAAPPPTTRGRRSPLPNRP